MVNTRQKGNRFENEVVERVYLPLDSTAENVGGGARKRFDCDIKTILSVNGKTIKPECKHNKQSAFLRDFKQCVSQSKRNGGVPVLHKRIHGTQLTVVVMKQEDYAELLALSVRDL